MTGDSSGVLLLVASAARSFRRGGLRSWITVVGIAVATMFAATASWVQTAASDLLVSNAKANLGSDATWSFILKPQDQERVMSALTTAEVVEWSPSIIGRSYARSPKRSSVIFVKGIEPERFPFYGRLRFYSGGDGLAADEVVLTQNVADRLELGIGDTIELFDGVQNTSFRIRSIISVYSEHVPDAHIFGVAYLPLSVARQLLGESDGMIQEASMKLQASLSAETVSNLESLHPTSTVYTVDAELAAMQAQVSQLLLFLHAFGVIALLIAAVGVGNTMAILVQSRTREIATMKAIGVRPHQVVSMVITEAALYGLLGSLLGVMGSMLVSDVARTWMGYLLQLELPARTYTEPLFLGALVGLGASILAGWLPAQQAAQIAPSIAWRDAQMERPDAVKEESLFQVLALLLVIGLLAGIYIHPMLVTARGAGSLVNSIVIGLLTTIGMAVGLSLMRSLFASILRRIGKWRQRAQGLWYFSLHHIASGVRRDALTCICLALSVFAFGLSTLVGNALKEGLREQLVRQSGGEVVVVSAMHLKETILQQLDSVPGILGIAEAIDVQAEILVINGEPANTRIEAAVTRQKEYLAQRTFRLQGINTERRPPYQITEGRDLTSADAGRPVMLILSDMASDLGIRVGDAVTIGVQGKPQAFEVVGLLQTELVKTAFMRTTAESLQAVDTPSLSLYLQIDPVDASDTLRRMNAALPRDAYAVAVDDNLMAVNQVLDLQVLVLAVISILALIAAVLLILNNVAISILQQRRDLAIMKMVGGTPAKLMVITLLHYGLLGFVSGGFGTVLASTIAALVGQLLLNTAVSLNPAYLIGIPLVVSLTAGLAAVTAAAPGISQKPAVVFRGA